MSVRKRITAILFVASVASAQAQTGDEFTLDTPIADIAADPSGEAVLNKDIPGLLTHPSYENFKGMSLNEVTPLSGGKITEQMLEQTGADLAAINHPSMTAANQQNPPPQ